MEKIVGNIDTEIENLKMEIEIKQKMIEQLEREKQVNPEFIEIPEVENIDIKDFGVIKRAEIRFTPGLNIILGKNASGKSTVIRYLFEKYTPDLMDRGRRVMFEIDKKINKTCIVFDDFLYGLAEKRLIQVLKRLESSGRQVIVTMCSPGIDFFKHNIKANVIDTSYFDLKKHSDYYGSFGMGRYKIYEDILKKFLEESNKEEEEKGSE